MKAVKVETDGSIKLPEEMLRLFPSSTELAVWTEGDTIVLKRLQPLKPSQIAERVSEKEMPLKDIAAEVHRMRRETRRRRG
jgi:hypothetical protein